MAEANSSIPVRHTEQIIDALNRATEMDVAPEQRTEFLLHELQALTGRSGRAFLILLQDLKRHPSPQVTARHVARSESDALPVAPLEVFQEAFEKAMPLFRPALREIILDMRSPHTVIGELDVRDKTWYQQNFVKPVLAQMGCADVMLSIWAASVDRAVAMLLLRTIDEKPFDETDRVLMTLMLRAVAPLVDREIFQVAQTLPIETDLTPRQTEVLHMLLHGESKKQIARQLSRSEHTIHTYIRQIYEALEVSSRGELMARFVDHRLARAMQEGSPLTLSHG
jgi:DNA-binding CsgD family transcriptional regulator